MGAISLKLEIRGANRRVTVTALLDTGARRNFMRRTLESGFSVDDVGISTFHGKQSAWLADGTEIVGDSVEFPSMCLLEREVRDAPFILLASLRADAIIGQLTMQDLDVHLRPHIHQAWRHANRGPG